MKTNQVTNATSLTEFFNQYKNRGLSVEFLNRAMSLAYHIGHSSGYEDVAVNFSQIMDELYGMEADDNSVADFGV